MRSAEKKKKSHIFYKQSADWGDTTFNANWKCALRRGCRVKACKGTNSRAGEGGQESEKYNVLIWWALSPNSSVFLNWLVQVISLLTGDNLLVISWEISSCSLSQDWQRKLVWLHCEKAGSLTLLHLSENTEWVTIPSPSHGHLILFNLEHLSEPWGVHIICQLGAYYNTAQKWQSLGL